MRLGVAVGIDVVAVLLFALVGRRSHDEANTFVDVLGTAWPYLAATVVGSLIAAVLPKRSGGNRSPYSWTTSVIVWVTTVVLGMVLRMLSGDTAAWPFWIVAFISLGILLIGWRVVARAVLRARARHTVTAGSPRHEGR
ncbi:DUF3054 domain-containing protein [Microlunatus elymi]|uniref:DUF3054 domain-containing protein n=1 Tax=Microlunatus elymi TaxID=2596828 RepID=UPI001AEF5B94|nr:DUF3054 domain-containing protein [Microlunatus elymi]